MIVYLTTICVYRDYNLSLLGWLYGATPSGQETALACMSFPAIREIIREKRFISSLRRHDSF